MLSAHRATKRGDDSTPGKRVLGRTPKAGPPAGGQLTRASRLPPAVPQRPGRQRRPVPTAAKSTRDRKAFYFIKHATCSPTCENGFAKSPSVSTLTCKGNSVCRQVGLKTPSPPRSSPDPALNQTSCRAAAEAPTGRFKSNPPPLGHSGRPRTRAAAG